MLRRILSVDLRDDETPTEEGSIGLQSDLGFGIVMRKDWCFG